jgi:hypothetical protein
MLSLGSEFTISHQYSQLCLNISTYMSSETFKFKMAQTKLIISVLLPDPNFPHVFLDSMRTTIYSAAQARNLGTNTDSPRPPFFSHIKFVTKQAL